MKVSVKTFREQIAMLKETVRIDWTQCVNETERKSTVKVLKSLASDLTEMECPRATSDDLERKELWLTKSADICSKYFSVIDSILEDILTEKSMQLV